MLVVLIIYFNFEKEIAMKKILISVFILFSFALSACNTVKGIGKDIEKSGEAIQRSADK